MITTQIDSFEDCRNVLMGEMYFPSHWRELALFQSEMPLMPQINEYIRRERTKVLKLITVRVDDKIAAYYIVQIAPGFHYAATLTATMDICYILPQYRGRGLALPLFRKVEQMLREIGVQVWYSGYKHRNPLGMDDLLEKFGFEPADVYCAKWIGN